MYETEHALYRMIARSLTATCEGQMQTLIDIDRHGLRAEMLEAAWLAGRFRADCSPSHNQVFMIVRKQS